jgi:glycosyltransferase involved in cell wall biosynthesis
MNKSRSPAACYFPIVVTSMRICIVAEHASRRFGGEAIIPYHYFRVLRSRGVEAWLVTHARTRPELETLFPADLDRMRFVDDSRLQKILFRIGELLPRKIAESTFGLTNQLLTQFFQRAVLRRLIAASEVDILHQPIPVSPRFPSLLFGLGAPLVVGPLNGGMDYPPAFRKSESVGSRVFVTVARSLSNIVNSILPGKKRADLVLVANERTRRALPSGLRGRVVEIPENAVDLTQWPATGRTVTDAGLFIFIGRLVDWKALDLIIRALKLVPGARLDVIGDGPMLSAWTRLAIELDLADRVSFLGWKTQEECALRLGAAVALVLPSLYECGGAVVLEAMAMSKPVIATKWGGPADYLDADSGILVEPDSPQALIDGFAAAMRRLATSPELCARLGSAGRNRLVRCFNWEKKVDQLMLLYASLLRPAGARS